MEGHDISDHGWIVGKARRAKNPPASGIVARAVLLSPVAPCPADVTPFDPSTGTVGNCVVNIDDLVAVLNAFGSCQIGVICNADVNGNCVVNIDDLTAVLNAFGTCTVGVCACSGGQASSSGGGNGFGGPDAAGATSADLIALLVACLDNASSEEETVACLLAVINGVNQD